MRADEGCVGVAVTWAKACVAFERSRGAVDPFAVVARRAKASRHAVWALVYRPPKSVCADLYLALGRIYERECLCQADKYLQEREKAQAKTSVGAALLRKADGLACQQDGGVNGRPYRDPQ